MEHLSMTDKDPTSLPFESSDPAEHKLWAALGDLPRGEPSSHLRRRFYSSLHDAESRRWTNRLADWLGMRPMSGLATAALSLVLGFGLAQLIDRPGEQTTRLATLEESVAHLQRELILDRLEDASVNTRLKGVLEAGEVAATDQQVALALLDRATQDQSLSVRSAAIDALGSQLGSGEIGNGLMRLLDSAESPIVQLSLVDLVLRHGDASQIRQLQELADSGQLHPDLVRHVNNALRTQSI
jgi:hypothetical protein